MSKSTTMIPQALVSIDDVHCQSKFTTIYHEAYAVDSLKVEIEAVKVEKGVLVIHIIISFSFWDDSCHHSTDLWAG